MYATYLEIKAGLGAAALEGLDFSATPPERWRHLLIQAYEYFAEEPTRARFLTQLEESPYYEEAHARLAAQGDPLSDAGQRTDLVELLVDLPWEVIYALSLGVAVRLAAAGVQLKEDELERLVDATWRAITKP